MLSRDQWDRLSSLAKTAPLVDWAIRYNPVVRSRVRRTIRRMAGAGYDDRCRLSEHLTRAILQRARLTPYGAAYNGALRHWPILAKEAVRDDPSAFVRRSLVRVPASTSGTTGLPIRLWRSFVSIASEQGFMDSLLGAHGLTMAGCRVAVLRGYAVTPVDDLSPPFGVLTHCGRRLTLSSSHLRQDSIGWYVDALRSFRPDVLWVYPSTIGNFLAHLDGPAAGLRIPLVLSSSEVLPAPLFRQIERQLGARVVDYYGQAERVCMAVSEGPGRYWFQPAYGRVELIPAGDGPTCGESLAAIVATGYWNGSMPLVRYDTGDQAIVPAAAGAADLEKIALGLLPFVGIAGRVDEGLVTPEGTAIFDLEGILHAPREVAHVLQIQLAQENPAAVTIRAVVKPDFSDADHATLLDNARVRIPASIKIDVALVDRLEKTPSGKTPFILRKDR